MENVVRKPVIYIAGPFRGPDDYTIHQNCFRAENLALKVWSLGAVALCPHLNTRHFHGTLPDEMWLEGDLELLRRCDAMVLTHNWETSKGAKTEYEFARIELAIDIFQELPMRDSHIAMLYPDPGRVTLREWIEEWKKTVEPYVERPS